MNAMDVTLAFGLLKFAGDKLASFLASEFSAISTVKTDLSDLQDIHGEVTSWLYTICDRSIENHRRFGWVIKLKDVAYAIEDLLYAVHLEAEKRKRDSDGGKYARAGSLCGKPKSFLFRCKVANEIKAIKVKLAAIAKQRNDMNAIWCNLPLNQRILSINRETGNLILLTDVAESQIPMDQKNGNAVGKPLESNGEDGWTVLDYDQDTATCDSRQAPNTTHVGFGTET